MARPPVHPPPPLVPCFLPKESGPPADFLFQVGRKPSNQLGRMATGPFLRFAHSPGRFLFGADFQGQRASHFKEFCLLPAPPPNLPAFFPRAQTAVVAMDPGAGRSLVWAPCFECIFVSFSGCNWVVGPGPDFMGHWVFPFAGFRRGCGLERNVHNGFPSTPQEKYP